MMGDIFQSAIELRGPPREGVRMANEARIGTLLESATQHKNSGEYNEAEGEYKEVLRLDPNNAEAHLGLGLVYCFTGRFEESVEELKRAVELAPNWVEARKNLALTYLMLGMYEEGKAEFLKLLKIDPDNPEAKKHLRFLEEVGGDLNKQNTCGKGGCKDGNCSGSANGGGT